MDVLKLTFDDESFDVVIDKGTLDSIVVQSHSQTSSEHVIAIL